MVGEQGRAPNRPFGNTVDPTTPVCRPASSLVLMHLVTALMSSTLNGCDLTHEVPPEAGPSPDSGGHGHAGVVSIGAVNSGSGVQFVALGYFGLGTITSVHLEAAMPGCALTMITDECVEVACASVPPTDAAGTMRVSGAGMPFDMTEQNGPFGTTNALVYLGSTTTVPTLGTAITVSAAGGVVPAFTGTVVVPPSADAINLTTDLTLSGGLTISWPPYASTAVDRTEVILAARGHRAICDWNGLAPTTSIPPVVTARFRTGEFVIVNAQLLNVTTVVAGDYTIGVEVGQAAVFSATVMP